MCWGDVIIGEKLDGAEEMRGVVVSWINRGEDGAEGVRGVVGFIGDDRAHNYFLNVVMKFFKS